MDNKFTNTEKLYRAIYPPEVMEMFWRKDGTLSSAAFADANGLSVDLRGELSACMSKTSLISERSSNICLQRVISSIPKYTEVKTQHYCQNRREFSWRHAL